MKDKLQILNKTFEDAKIRIFALGRLSFLRFFSTERFLQIDWHN